GLCSPTEVVSRAAGFGLTHLALTDHDTTAGLAEAGQAAESLPITLITGVEISIAWEDMPVHLVALGFDVSNPVLQAGLASIRGGRFARGQRMAEALAAVGIEGTLEGALALAPNPDQLSRAHFARHLVERGLFKTPSDVFAKYLSPGRPGYVSHQWATLSQALSWIEAAKGVAVIAHPGRYKFSSAVLHRLFVRFKEQGGQAIEVSSGGHNVDQIRHFAHVARRYGFYASRGSDFHGPREGAALGHVPQLPEDLKPVWKLLGY
ncbi:MAG: PHP domain-containing protein, partial [Zoogloeaceae bacterium]|nr:PHP domain-containing protein [Zoogloeaceae bacterium]